MDLPMRRLRETNAQSSAPSCYSRKADCPSWHAARRFARLRGFRSSQHFACVILMLAIGSCSAATVHVAPIGGGGTNSLDCGNASMPCATLQYALNHHTRNNSTTTVLALPGTHQGGIVLGARNGNVIVQGTGKAVVDCAGWGRGFIIQSGAPVVANLTVKNCSANNGGGIAVTGGTPRLTDLVVERSKATQAGGGIYIQREAKPELLRVVVRGNTAAVAGGGIFIGGSGSQATLTDCTISDNSAPNAGYGGGGVLIQNKAVVFFVRTRITSNTAAGVGGGIFIQNSGSQATLTDCIISNNSAANNAYGGGGVYIGTEAVVFFVRTRITSNTAARAGGGIFIQESGSQATLTDCIISDNSAADAAWGGGGVFIQTKAVVFFVRTRITSNTAAGVGGGISIRDSGSQANLSDCTISDNSAANAAWGGGGVFIQTKAVVFFVRTRITSNTAAGVGGGIFMADSGSQATLTDCTISDNSAANDAYGGGTIGNNDGRLGGGGLHITAAEVSLIGCLVSGNKAGVGAVGGGVLVIAPPSKAARMCEHWTGNITGNKAGGSGGGLYISFGGECSGFEFAVPKKLCPHLHITSNTAGTSGPAYGNNTASDALTFKVSQQPKPMLRPSQTGSMKFQVMDAFQQLCSTQTGVVTLSTSPVLPPQGTATCVVAKGILDISGAASGSCNFAVKQAKLGQAYQVVVNGTVPENFKCVRGGFTHLITVAACPNALYHCPCTDSTCGCSDTDSLTKQFRCTAARPEQQLSVGVWVAIALGGLIVVVAVLGVVIYRQRLQGVELELSNEKTPQAMLGNALFVLNRVLQKECPILAQQFLAKADEHVNEACQECDSDTNLAWRNAIDTLRNQKHTRPKYHLINNNAEVLNHRACIICGRDADAPDSDSFLAGMEVKVVQGKDLVGAIIVDGPMVRPNSKKSEVLGYMIQKKKCSNAKEIETLKKQLARAEKEAMSARKKWLGCLTAIASDEQKAIGNPEDALLCFGEKAQEHSQAHFQATEEKFQLLRDCKAKLDEARASGKVELTPAFWKPLTDIRDLGSAIQPGCSHVDGPGSTYVKASELADENPEMYEHFKSQNFNFHPKDDSDLLQLFSPFTKGKNLEWQNQDLSNTLNLIICIDQTEELKQAAVGAKNARNDWAHAATLFFLSAATLKGYVSDFRTFAETFNQGPESDLQVRITALEVSFNEMMQSSQDSVDVDVVANDASPTGQDTEGNGTELAQLNSVDNALITAIVSV